MIQVLLDLYGLLVKQFIQIMPFWLLGAVAGAVVSVFAGSGISRALTRLQGPRFAIIKILLAAILGAASPLCMFGTIPLIYTFGKKGVPQHLLATFMVSSILINPNLFIFSFALGVPMALLRLFLCLAAGFAAGVLVKQFYDGKELFNFNKYTPKNKTRPDVKPFVQILQEFNNTIVKTFPYILAGICLAALFEEFVPKDAFASVFSGNKGFGVLLATGLGVPVYVCGGGTIPLIYGWLQAGMSTGSAMAFMVTGPATKFSNLSAVKIILGTKNLAIYISYVLLFAIFSGLAVDILHTIIG